MLMLSADYQFNHSLQRVSKIASAIDSSTFLTKSKELPHLARRVFQGKKIRSLKEVPVALRTHRRGLSH